MVAASAGDGTIAFRKSNREDPRDAGHRYGDKRAARQAIELAIAFVALQSSAVGASGPLLLRQSDRGLDAGLVMEATARTYVLSC